ncbi:HU family DNA-binding protein [Paenibacillus sp. N1-5-1-14]|uniref:HU family DNA-binding protein n=1 Tax=Paenibacillus radicibacter TaxID=2972488 RepID=UPI002159228D|nr:HU family DNA-binding protein [Paenibacillus radicibacter]MCR8641530.1 HU family DNA-binding protein [Paenibacillus radicibacter]
MNKDALVKSVAGVTGVSKKEVSTLVDAVFQVIGEALASGEEVSIAGHGKYAIRERAERQGINPKLMAELKEQGVDQESAKAQAAITIESSKTVGFKPAKALKDSVNV